MSPLLALFTYFFAQIQLIQVHKVYFLCAGLWTNRPTRRKGRCVNIEVRPIYVIELFKEDLRVCRLVCSKGES